jgi:hypothetical protein
MELRQTAFDCGARRRLVNAERIRDSQPPAITGGDNVADQGVIAFDGADGGPLPAASRATTLKV